MRISIFMIFQFFSILSAWALKALADGKVTATEALELVLSFCALLGVTPEFQIPAPVETLPSEPQAAHDTDFLDLNTPKPATKGD